LVANIPQKLIFFCRKRGMTRGWARASSTEKEKTIFPGASGKKEKKGNPEAT